MLQLVVGIITVFMLSGCVHDRPVQAPFPQLPPLRSEVLFQDAEMGDITDLLVERDSAGAISRVIVAASSGVAVLDAHLQIIDKQTFRRSGLFNARLVDLDGDGRPELVESGNDIFKEPLTVRDLSGELRWTADIPLEPSHFAHQWVRWLDRDGDGRRELYASVSGASQAAVFDHAGAFVGMIECEEPHGSKILVCDIDGDGSEELVLGCDGCIVARDGFGNPRGRWRLPTNHRFVSDLEMMEDESGRRVPAALNCGALRGEPKSAGQWRWFIPPGDLSGADCVELQQPRPAGERGRFERFGEATIVVTRHFATTVTLQGPDGEWIASTTFAGPGDGPCGQIVHFGTAVLVRRPGSEFDEILVGHGNTLSLARPAPPYPVHLLRDDLHSAP